MTMRWSAPGYERVADLVTQRAGIAFADGYAETAEMYIDRCIAEAGLAGPDDLARVLADDDERLDELVAVLTVGETYFFRDPVQWSFIREQILPALLDEGTGRVRIWSAGCATGEEAYSMAILADQLGVLDRVTVVGTDVNQTRLAAAREATYRRWSFRGAAPDYLPEYFDETAGGRYVLHPRIRDAVTFRAVNLLDAGIPGPGTVAPGQDLILCRNVFIYFSRDTAATVAAALLRTLSPVGWLLTGAADPRLSPLVDCRAVVSPAGVAYRRSDARPSRAAPPSDRETADHAAPTPDAADPWPQRNGRPPRRKDRVPGPAAPGRAASGERGPARGTDEPGSAPRGRSGAGTGGPEEPAHRSMVARVRALMNLGQFEAALAAVDEALARRVRSPELYYLRSVVLAQLGEERAALDAARSALYLDRGMIVAHLAEADGFRRMGNGERARRSYRNARRLLHDLPPRAPVPAADGTTVGRMLEQVETWLAGLEAST